MRKMAYETIMDTMKEKILSGEWSTGSRLPTLVKLAEELKVGVSTVREALRILENQRWVSIEQGRGIYVNSNPSFLEDPTAGMRELEGGSVLMLLEARLIVEPELARFAAERGTPTQLKRIREAAQKMASQIEAGQDFYDADLSFHEMIAEAANNPMLMKMMEAILELFFQSWRQTRKLPGMDDKSKNYHDLISRAIEDRHSEQAHTLMRAHILEMVISMKKELK